MLIRLGPSSLVRRLSSYAFMHSHGNMAPATPQRLVRPTSSTLEVPQIEDNPRLWRRARLTHGMDIASGYETSAINTAWNTYVRHEEVASCIRERWCETNRWQRVERRRENAERYAYLDVLDPTEFSLPGSIFAKEAPTGHQDCANKRAIVRTGKPHVADLMDFIRSRKSRKTLPPRGFLALPDSGVSLPPRFGRQAGQSLDNHAHIAAAFKVRNEVKRGDALPRREGFPGYYHKPRPSVTTTVGRWGNTADAGPAWDQDRIKREAADRRAKADEKDAIEGPPAEYRPSFIFDPDGRQHNLNITAPGSLISQVYSPWDVARPPDPNQMPDNLLQRLRVLLNTKEWNPDEEDVDRGDRIRRKHGHWSRRRGRGRGRGVKSQPSRSGGRGRGGQSQPSWDQGRDGDGGPQGAVADITRNLTNTSLQNSFAAWKKQTLGKRVRFGGMEDGDYTDRKGDLNMAKSVKVY